jgi:UDP-N-acetylmuramoylalanine--D-glutamate ligase
MSGEFHGRRAIVMGLGRFGGGIGVTRWLCGQGAKVLVTDMASEDKLAESLQLLDGLEFTRRLGGHELSDLDRCDLLVVSPAVDKKKSSFFQEAVSRKIPWTSEMNLFLERCRGTLVGITGTVGKSTTTAMIGAILDLAARFPDWAHGKVWLGGNIGKSLLDDLPNISATDVVVLELSSFQLEDAAGIRRSPHIAVITNLRDNHLDRHGTMAEYAEAKSNIFRHQKPADHLLMPLDEDLSAFPGQWRNRENLRWYGVNRQRQTMRFSRSADPHGESVELAAKLKVPGLHNLMNAAAAVSVARLLGVTDDISCRALSDFGGLPHRLEFVGEFTGIKYYNDSKATTPEAAMTSLAAFESPVILVVGGSDKGSPFDDLARAVAHRAKAAICIGQTGPRLADEIERFKSSGSGAAVERASDFPSALVLARRHARSGDVILLSPGCASYDWFKNYEDRGEQFRRLAGQ